MAGDAPFEEAYAAVKVVEDIVGEQIDSANASAQGLQQTALASITALSGVNFDFSAGELPGPPAIDSTVDVHFDLPIVSPSSFGVITSQATDAPFLEAVPAIPVLSIPDFQSSIGSLTIPVPPSWDGVPNAPDAPELSTVDIPVAPDIVLPPLPQLEDITVPTFEGLNLPIFDATAPEFEGSALPGILQWSEPEYHPEILGEVVDKIRTLWSGGSGIPPAVEQAMFDRAAEREELSTSRDVDAISDEFSLRGFTMPTGMQAARTDQMVQDLSAKKLGLNRELTIQIAQWQIENIRFACTTGIAAENVYVNIFLNAAQRMFEAARFQVESQISIYNAQVSLFNARMNGYQISAQVFNTLVQAELSKIAVFRAEIDAEIARGQLNVQKVQVYSAQVSALQTQIEIYKAQMQGAEVQSGVIRNQIEGYKASVQAYAEQINAQKTKFDAYESQVKGEAAKAGIIDSEARAYASMVQGKVSVTDAYIKIADVTIEKNRLNIQKYSADLDAEKTRIQSQLSVIQSGAQAYIADTQRYTAIATAEGTRAQVDVAAKEAELRTNVSFYEAQVQAYLGNMEQLIRKTATIIDSLKAAGSISSTLAAGAMAGVHVGATLSGGGSVSASGSSAYSNSYQKSESTSEQHSVTENTTTTYEGT